MQELKIRYPYVYKYFKKKGFHTVRRSDTYWAGLWTDLTIEQGLMCSIKSRGGITRSRGISESVRLFWLESMHPRASVHDSMSSLNNMNRISGKQYVELGASRKQSDLRDMSLLTKWLQSHNPFDTTSEELAQFHVVSLQMKMTKSIVTMQKRLVVSCKKSLTVFVSRM